MRILCVSLFMLFTAASFLSAQQPTKGKQESPEEIAKAGIMQHYQRLASDNPKVRGKQFDEVLPTEETAKALFGEDAQYVWPRLSQIRETLIANTDAAKKEADLMGKIVSVELIDVREKDDVYGRSHRYQIIVDNIPEDIPVYEAKLTFTKSTGQGGFFVVVDGQMKFLRGLNQMIEYIQQQKKAK